MTYAVFENENTSAATEGSYAISGQRAKSRTATRRQWRYMIAGTAAAVSIKLNEFIDTIPKGIQTGIK